MLFKDIYNKEYNIEITGVQTDSRFVKTGNLFLPIEGNTFSGNEFIIDAINNGAVAIISNKPINNTTVPVIVVDNLEKDDWYIFYW